MNRIEDDFLYLIHLLSNKKTAKGLLPHKRTIVNILKGNKSSVNARNFNNCELFGKYPYFNSYHFEDFIIRYGKQFLSEHKKNDKIRYFSNNNLVTYFDNLNINLDDELTDLNKKTTIKVDKILDDYFK